MSGRAARFTVEATSLTVERLDSRGHRRQGIVIEADDDLNVAGITASRVVLWADRAPHTVEIELDAPCEIRCWNVWDDDGLVQAWLGGACIDVDEADDTGDPMLLDSAVVLFCHDGHATDDDPDLVVRISPGGE